MAEKIVPDLPAGKGPQFTWDPRIYGGKGGYRDPRGRFVSWARVRNELDVVLNGLSAEMKALTGRLAAGEITIAEWQTAMMPMIKTTHMTSAAAASGGWGQMTFADYGRAGQRIRDEYAYHRKFAEQLASGEQSLSGASHRAGLYGQGGRETFCAFEQAKAHAAGHDEERSTLNPAEHCATCVEEAAKGWVPIGRLIPIGRRDCLSNCKCGYETRKRPEEKNEVR